MKSLYVVTLNPCEAMERFLTGGIAMSGRTVQEELDRLCELYQKGLISKLAFERDQATIYAGLQGLVDRDQSQA